MAVNSERKPIQAAVCVQLDTTVTVVRVIGIDYEVLFSLAIVEIRLYVIVPQRKSIAHGNYGPTISNVLCLSLNQDCSTSKLPTRLSRLKFQLTLPPTPEPYSFNGLFKLFSRACLSQLSRYTFTETRSPSHYG